MPYISGYSDKYGPDYDAGIEAASVGTSFATPTNVIQSNPVTRETNSLDALWNLAQSNPEYMEVYLQALAERENTTNAQAWYEKMASSQYQRAAEDLRKAGLNSYLSLNSLGGAGSGSVNPASTWSTSPYTNAQTKRKADTDNINAVFKGLGVVTSIIAALAMLL